MTLDPFGSCSWRGKVGAHYVACFWRVRETSRRPARVYWRLDSEPHNAEHHAGDLEAAAADAFAAWQRATGRLAA